MPHNSRTIRRAGWPFALLALAMTLPLLAAPAVAQGDPYGADPHRVVPFADTVQRVYSSGTDLWEVWICGVPGPTVTIDLNAVVEDLNTIVTPYFQWLSGSRYAPVFTAGGQVTSNDIVPAVLTNESFQMPGCESAVEAATGGGSEGALIVVAADFDEGYATGGAFCPEEPFTGCVNTYPQNARRAVVGAAAVTTFAPGTEPSWSSVAHELGHGLNWAHSYGGLTEIPGTTDIDTYDNPMDLMSGGARTRTPVAAIAYDRYAAGWIEPSQVDIHTSGSATYRLAAIGTPGTQMLVLPLEEGHFYTLGTRRLTSYDSRLPRAGVEVYEVDQRRTACQLPAVWPSTWPCFATLLRIAQNPAVEGVGRTVHVLGIDAELDLGSFSVRVDAADSTSFTVIVTDDPTPAGFIDDDGNPHEMDIEAIAALGITVGCNPPLNDRFCPSRTVTRAEMSAFLIRAIGQESSLSPYVGLFPDVPNGVWYAPYVERLFTLGITEGFDDGTYRPNTQVNRAQMAAFLVRAFEHSDQLITPAGVFDDVDPGAWYTPFAEAIYRLDITRGCATNPLAYCPFDPVRRDHMASFLARALGLA